MRLKITIGGTWLQRLAFIYSRAAVKMVTV